MGMSGNIYGVCRRVFAILPGYFDATAKSPKNAAKTVPTLQNRGGKVLLTLASIVEKRDELTEQV
jgi:hypothetical protein